MPRELYGALALTAMFAVLLGVVELLARRTSISPEGSRKLVHLGGGAGCLLFPLLLDRPLTVLLLAGLFGGFFWLAERRRGLLCLCRVSRSSRGSVYYPFAIAAIFWLTAGRYDLYLSAVLVLTVADSAAALVGSRYGRIRFRTGGVDESKSLEGSLIFWALSFLAVFLPLAWPGGAASLGQALFSAFLTASLLTAVEAVSLGGRDNLYVPLLAAFMLLKAVSKPVPELAMQSASFVLLFVGMGVVNRYGRMLRTRALLIMGILVYGAWSLGSADWAIPLAAAFAYFAGVFNATGSEQHRTRVHRRMAMLTAPAAALVLAANLTGAFAFLYGPFLAAVLVPLLWGVALQLGALHGPTGWGWSGRQLGGALGGAAAVLAEPVLMRRAPEAVSVLGLAVGALLIVWLGIGLRTWRPRGPGGRLVFLAACLAAALTAFGQRTGLLNEWTPFRWADVYRREADVLLPLKKEQAPPPVDRADAGQGGGTWTS